MFNQLFGPSRDWSTLMVALAAALALAYVTAEIAARLARAALLFLLEDSGAGRKSPGRLRPPGAASAHESTGMVRRPVRIVRAIVLVLMTAVLFRPILNIAGVQPRIGIESRALNAWLFDSGLRIGLLVVVTYLLVRLIAAVTGRFEELLRRDVHGGIDALERDKRVRTLGAMLERVLTIIVVSIGALMILRELRVDITPILTGAGIVGLAVGFGAQTLVRDIISGFFVILENQVRVGDVAVINGVGGLVEAINLRTIVLRDFEGVVHIFPNGSVTTLANRTKDYSYAVVDVGISYREDPDAVMALLKDIGRELSADPAFRGSILEPLEVVGIEALGEMQVMIRTRTKTVPVKQWDVARELRKRIKRTFDAHGIRFRGPQAPSGRGAASPPAS